jgi:HD superfamily phosphohydrolase
LRVKLYIWLKAPHFLNLQSQPNKRKILNDPVYGFITIPYEIVADLINHPWFQRLRRIKQLGLSHLVYPGALHTRFHHAIGAMHLMVAAIETIRNKGHEITKDEEIGAVIAILLHDIGHAPFSHTLENTIVEGVQHEELSLVFMQHLNKEFNGALDTAISIFTQKHPKKFLSQLVSGQLDMDRLDYLRRDSFYSGVSEGVVSSQRIIKMLNIANGNLVVEEKGIYSIEKFIVARRLMYWQVYLHKTVIAAEYMLIRIMQRAKELASSGHELFCSPDLRNFLYHSYPKEAFQNNPSIIASYAKLDDYDIFGAIKVWGAHSDRVLSTLCRNLINRNLFRIELSKVPFDGNYILNIKNSIADKYSLNNEELDYFFISDDISNMAYAPDQPSINILMKNGQICDIAEASDTLNISALSTPVKKFFICYPKGL